MIELWPLYPHNLLKKKICQSDPPPQEELKCKNAQFLQWILEDDVYLQNITES